MKRSAYLWPALLLALSAHVATAQPPSAAPPKLEKIEDTGDDAITVNARQAPAHEITQKREGGVITEETVKSGPSTYTVHTAPVNGNTMPGDTFGRTNHGPQWTVMQFDLGKKKKASKEEDASADDNAPPAVK
ncbi:hypothetical protein [Rugamonas sp.]|uniref:hypothetical protein n=1 Tax=Rugamonas sp. TaxID=1926287 RepID=UPI0025CE2258|nr:hypothetical protein [Rugamonas sp.]